MKALNAAFGPAVAFALSSKGYLLQRIVFVESKAMGHEWVPMGHEWVPVAPHTPLKELETEVSLYRVPHPGIPLSTPRAALLAKAWQGAEIWPSELLSYVDRVALDACCHYSVARWNSVEWEYRKLSEPRWTSFGENPTSTRYFLRPPGELEQAYQQRNERELRELEQALVLCGTTWLSSVPAGLEEPVRPEPVATPPKGAGYHQREIPLGVFGEASKIEEEFTEWQDAHDQGVRIMELNELADLYGAIEGYLKSRFQMTMSDLEAMSDRTAHAFENGYRTPKGNKA